MTDLCFLAEFVKNMEKLLQNNGKCDIMGKMKQKERIMKNDRAFSRL